MRARLVMRGAVAGITVLVASLAFAACGPAPGAVAEGSTAPRPSSPAAATSHEVAGSLSPSRASPGTAMSPAWVTGTITLAPATSCIFPVSSSDPTEGGVEHLAGSRCEDQPIEASDPRLSGSSVEQWSQDTYKVIGQPTMTISTGTYDVHNADGSWQCGFAASFTHNVDPSYSVSSTETSTCVGAGAYEGLSAILAIDWSQHGLATVPFTAVIFPGKLPSSL